MKNKLASLAMIVGRLPANAPEHEKIKSVLNRLHTEAQNIAKIVAEPDPMKSAAAITLVLNAEKARLRELAAKSRADIASVLTVNAANVQATQTKNSKLIPNEYASEIRSVFRALDNGEKAVFIEYAATTNDGPTLAAILQAPAVLTGLSPQLQADYKQYYFDLASPLAKGQQAAFDETQAVCSGVLQLCDQIAQPVA
jgi:hypothetical protein